MDAAMESRLASAGFHATTVQELFGLTPEENELIESRLATNEAAATACVRLRGAITSASAGLVEREALVETVILAAVAGEHLLVIGPPGTAKSEAVRRIARALGGHYFEYLLGRFTEPNEVFGPVDLRRLREGVVETQTGGMLPEADIAFLDEIFLGSTAILNTLLGLLNERVFRRGHTQFACPLRICVGASNRLPEDDMLAAFADRFLARVYLDSIPDPRLEELLEGGWNLSGGEQAKVGTDDVNPISTPVAATLADVDALARIALAMDMTLMRPLLSQAIRRLRQAGITLSDRRAVKVQKLIAAAAALDGRTVPAPGDLWPLILAVPTQEQQTLAREILRDLLEPTANATLRMAAEEASAGPLARAARLAHAGQELLSNPPAANAPAEEEEGWKLRLEGLAREIDAGFTLESLPSALAEVRAQIVKALQVESEE